MRIRSGLILTFPSLAAALFAAALLIGSAEAHHSPAGFDIRKTTTVTGVVKQYEWFNPHVYITLEQTTASGQKIELQIECQAPVAMSAMGWTKETLRVGDTLAITGSPAKDPNSKGFLAGSIKRADTTLLDMADMAKQKPQPTFVAQGLAGNWQTTMNMPVVFRATLPNATQLSPEYVEAFKRFDEKAMNPSVNCIAATAPGTMVLPDLKQITLRDNVLEIRTELNDGLRTIHLGAITHEGAIPSHQGHSIAKWEGKTLVIDTTHFAYHGGGNGIGVPSGTKKHLIEKLTPSADGTSLTYRFENSDPEYLKVPNVGEVKWSYRPDKKFASERCNLDSARRFTTY